MSTAEEKTGASSRISKFFRSESVIGTLVALLSILTAVIGYQASLTDSKANDLTLKAQRTLSEADREFLVVSQDINTDLISYDNYFASEDEEAAENYAASFSDALVENLDDPDREFLFDEIYYEEMYGLANLCFFESDVLFAQGDDVGNLADQYQLVMFIFAIGLAMAAWASLLSDTGNMRPTFVIFAIAALIFGGIFYLNIATEATEILSNSMVLPPSIQN